MNPDIRHWEALLCVARLGSFTKAARLLHISQPALTVQVNQLEEALGARMFDRNTRSVRLTPVGKELVPVVERIVRELETLVSNTQARAAGRKGFLNIAALPYLSSTVVPMAIARFRQSHPGISVSLKDAIGQRVLEMVRAEEVDFGIVSFGEVDPDLQLSVFFRDKMSVAFTQKFPLANKKVIRIHDLVHFPLILTNSETGTHGLVNRALLSIGHFTKPAFEVAYVTTAIALAQQGVGVAVIPFSYLTNVSHSLTVRKIEQPTLIRNVGAVSKFGHTLSPAAEQFLKILKSACKELYSDSSDAPPSRR